MSLICPECADHRHATCDRYHDVADRCGCDHPHHDEPDDDGHGERTVLAFDAQGVDGYEL